MIKRWGTKKTLRWETILRAQSDCGGGNHNPVRATAGRPYSYYCATCGACAYTVNTVVKLA